jgi:hypothetical protein
MTRKGSALLARQRDNFGDLHRAASSVHLDKRARLRRNIFTAKVAQTFYPERREGQSVGFSLCCCLHKRKSTRAEACATQLWFDFAIKKGKK